MKKPSIRTLKSLVNRYFDESVSLELTLATMLDMTKGFGPLEQAMLLSPHIEEMLERTAHYQHHRTLSHFGLPSVAMHEVNENGQA